jgi:hypothetical protein
VAKQLAVVELEDDGTVRVRVEGRVRELTALVREAAVEAVAQALLPDGDELGPELPADEWRARWAAEVERRGREGARVPLVEARARMFAPLSPRRAASR